MSTPSGTKVISAYTLAFIKIINPQCMRSKDYVYVCVSISQKW